MNKDERFREATEFEQHLSDTVVSEFLNDALANGFVKGIPPHLYLCSMATALGQLSYALSEDDGSSLPEAEHEAFHELLMANYTRGRMVGKVASDRVQKRKEEAEATWAADMKDRKNLH
jgi:hypothetical protein